MTDDADKAKEIQKPLIAPEVLRGGVIKNGEQQADWRTTQHAHMLGQDESATDLFYKPGHAELPRQKFELIDSAVDASPAKTADDNEQVLDSATYLANGTVLEKERLSRHVRKETTEPVIALRDDYLNRYELKPLLPIDGQTMTLHEALTVFKTPFMDAYEHSRKLKNGEPGKSKTLEEVVDRLKECPWMDKIRIKFDSRAENPEYDDFNSTITIRPQDKPDRQIANFAHEGFHATHQFLSKLYDSGIVSPKEFEDIWMKGEVDAMLTEAKVFLELGLKGEPPRFDFDHNGKLEFIYIQNYARAHGESGLLEFLRNAQPTGRHAEPYGEHYSSFYSLYSSKFETNKTIADQYILRWEQSGHKPGDI